MTIFKAGVQYDDFKGSVASDVSDEKSMLEFLKDEGVADHNENLLGYRVCFGGNHGNDVEKPGVVVYLGEGSPSNPPSIVRAIEIDMTIARFFAFFKRFDLVMVRKDFDLNQADVDGPH